MVPICREWEALRNSAKEFRIFHEILRSSKNRTKRSIYFAFLHLKCKRFASKNMQNSAKNFPYFAKFFAKYAKWKHMLLFRIIQMYFLGDNLGR